MKVRSFKTDLETLKQTSATFLKQCKDSMVYHKALVVDLYINGASTKYLSERTQKSRATIKRWVKIADEQGFDALKRSYSPGRPCKLTDKQLAEVRKAVLSSPETYDYVVWDGKSVSDFIAKKYSVSLGIRQCQNILKHKFSLSLLRPQTLPSKGKDNSEEREEFKKKLLNS